MFYPFKQPRGPNMPPPAIGHRRKANYVCPCAVFATRSVAQGFNLAAPSASNVVVARTTAASSLNLINMQAKKPKKVCQLLRACLRAPRGYFPSSSGVAGRQEGRQEAGQEGREEGREEYAAPSLEAHHQPRPAAHAFRLRTMRAEVVKKVVKKAIKKAPVRKAQRGKSYASMQRDGKGPFDDIYKLAGDFVQAFGALGKK